MKKKLGIVIVLLVVVLAIVFWQISKNSGENGTSSKRGVMKIGAVLPMTGQASGYGKWMQRGIELAVDDVNTAGGVNGKKLAVAIEDSKSDNRAGVDAANKLISIDKVPIIITIMTGVTQSIIPVTERNRVILFTLATSPGITEKRKYVFRNATNIANEVDRMVGACKTNLQLKRVAIIYINNPVGPWIRDRFTKSLAEIGSKVVAAESFQPDSTDFRTQLLRIKKVNPQAVYILGYQQNGLIMKQARELGIKGQFLGVTDCELPDVVKVAGSAANGVIYTKAAFDPTSASGTAKTFVMNYGSSRKSVGNLYLFEHASKDFQPKIFLVS